MIIKQAEFIKSAAKPSHYPDSDIPEIAFAGRSNVGKSSLINCLVQRRRLVKTSAKPGCTQLINFFLVNQALFFVDLPGYGYARVSKKIRSTWLPMVETYLSTRRSLAGLVLLADIRRDPGPEEMSLAQWLEDHGLPCMIVLTKSDKLSKTKQNTRSRSICDRLGRPGDSVIRFSAKTGQGREQLLKEIDCRIEWYAG